MSPAIVGPQRRFQRIRWETGHVSTAESNANPSRASRPDSFFEAVGGHATFEKLVRVFYEGVAEDPIMREMYPKKIWGRQPKGCNFFWSSTGAVPPCIQTPGGTRAFACATCPIRLTPMLGIAGLNTRSEEHTSEL